MFFFNYKIIYNKSVELKRKENKCFFVKLKFYIRTFINL